MEISLEDVVLNNLRLGELVNFEPEENEAFDAENTKVYGKEEHNNPLELFPNESELITVEKSNVNEVKVGIGEFSNKPLQLLASAALIHNQNIVDKEDVAIALLLVVVFLYN